MVNWNPMNWSWCVYTFSIYLFYLVPIYLDFVYVAVVFICNTKKYETKPFCKQGKILHVNWLAIFLKFSFVLACSYLICYQWWVAGRNQSSHWAVMLCRMHHTHTHIYIYTHSIFNIYIHIFIYTYWDTRWWFHFFSIFTPTWGRFPFWLIFFRWVETTN